MLGVDWRHFENAERVFRFVIDFIKRNGGKIIPVELVEFDAKAICKCVDINWTTASELGSEGFEVEKAEMNEAGRSDFVKIAELESAGTSSEMLEYGPVHDYAVEYGNVYVYRLKMIDIDGNWKYSDEKVVTVGSGALWLSEAQPNPGVDKVIFDIQGAIGNADITLYDVSGNEVSTLINTVNNTVEVDVRNLSGGAYTLVFKSGDVVLTRQLRVVK